MENPKHIRAQKDGKSPMEYLVYSVLEEDARVHKHGADKYGVRNWRKDKILASTYEASILRHFLAWCRGEDIDPDSGEPHLAHIRACCAVVRDAEMNDTLIDDRDRCESKEPVEYSYEPVTAMEKQAQNLSDAIWVKYKGAFPPVNDIVVLDGMRYRFDGEHWNACGY